jgi:hypothetical protein
LKNVDETFRKNVESNVFSRKMLIQLFSEKCWLNIFIENFTTFLENDETFSNARADGKKEAVWMGFCGLEVRMLIHFPPPLIPPSRAVARGAEAARHDAAATQP